MIFHRLHKRAIGRLSRFAAVVVIAAVPGGCAEEFGRGVGSVWRSIFG